MKQRVIWKDKAGNAAYERKMEHKVQYVVKNAEGRIVNTKDSMRVLRKVVPALRGKSSVRKSGGHTYTTFKNKRVKQSTTGKGHIGWLFH
jgi:hypothetical protein